MFEQPMADMLPMLHRTVGIPEDKVIPLNVCSLLCPGCDSFDIHTVQTKLFLLPQVKCFTIAETKEPVHAAQGFILMPHYTFEDHPDIDVLIVGAQELNSKPALNWLKNTVPKVRKYVVGVCGGAILLASAGVLDGKRATATKFGFPMTTQFAKDVIWDDTVNYVEDGKFITTGGACAGLNGAFHIIRLLYGRDVAMKLAFLNEHPWLDDPKQDPFVAVFENGTLKSNAVQIYDERKTK